MSRLIENLPFAGNGGLSTMRFLAGVGVWLSGAGVLMAEAVGLLGRWL